MSSQDLHQVILRWPYTDANEVSVTGTFDKPEWKTSLHLTRKPDGFEAPPIYVPWRNKFAYKFVVDGRWVTNDAEPTEVAPGGFVNNVYTAPPKPVLPEPEPSTAPPSYHSESEVEHEPAEKVADKPTANGTVLHVVRDTPTPTPDAAPEQHPRVPDVESDVIVDSAPEAVQETVAPVVEAAQAAFSQVAPAPIKVEKAADEITSESEAPKDSPSPAASEQPIQIPVPELAPNVPIGILPNSTPGSPSQDSTPTTRVDSEREVSTHVPLRFGSDTAVPQVEEVAPAPESVSRLEDATPAPVEAPEETTPAPVEEEREPEEATTAPVKEGEPEETTPAPVEEEGEPEGTTPAPVEDIDWKAAVLSEHKETTPTLVEEKPEETTSALVEEKPEEPTPVLVEVESPKEEALAPAEVEGTAVPEPAPAPPTEPVHVPAAAKEPESVPPQEPEEVTPPASQEPAGVPEPSSQLAPEPVPEAKAEVAVVQVPAPEATPVAEPAPVVEATPTKAPVAAPEPTPQVAPAVNGHSKTMSGASTSTAAPTLPETVGRKTSRKFSFPGHGKDKSGNSSPTGSSRFASQQKREKRHSLLHKLKEIFSDKGKKKSEAKA
ncbi:hypothetical protein EDB83DRAFT_699214 [Lactarius deliciosus]|nr:hypothetical protein EDB83DRAFT_699214 [Lactarius deliciosus]